MSMRVIRPVPITGPMLASTTAVDASLPAWAAGTTYGLGAQVTVGYTIYESLQAANTGNSPAAASSTWWKKAGTINSRAMFDESIGTVTTGPAPLTVVLRPGAVTGLTLLGLEGATQVNVTVRDLSAGTELAYHEIDLGAYAIGDWLEYWTAPIEYRAEATLLDLPAVANSEIEVTILGSGTVGCGTLVVGSSTTLGKTTYGASVEIIDYSKKAVDAAGNLTLEQGVFSRRINLPVVFEPEALNKVYAFLSGTRATLLVFIAIDDETGYEALIVYGWTRNFSIDLRTSALYYCTLQAEGLSK